MLAQFLAFSAFVLAICWLYSGPSRHFATSLFPSIFRSEKQARAARRLECQHRARGANAEAKITGLVPLPIHTANTFHLLPLGHQSGSPIATVTDDDPSPFGSPLSSAPSTLPSSDSARSLLCTLASVTGSPAEEQLHSPSPQSIRSRPSCFFDDIRPPRRIEPIGKSSLIPSLEAIAELDDVLCEIIEEQTRSSKALTTVAAWFGLGRSQQDAGSLLSLHEAIDEDTGSDLGGDIIPEWVHRLASSSCSGRIATTHRHILVSSTFRRRPCKRVRYNIPTSGNEANGEPLTLHTKYPWRNPKEPSPQLPRKAAYRAPNPRAPSTSPTPSSIRTRLLDVFVRFRKEKAPKRLSLFGAIRQGVAQQKKRMAERRGSLPTRVWRSADDLCAGHGLPTPEHHLPHFWDREAEAVSTGYVQCRDQAQEATTSDVVEAWLRRKVERQRDERRAHFAEYDEQLRGQQREERGIWQSV